jgi:hypothetical protein
MSTTPPAPPNKPTIDERIAALTMNLELERHEREMWEKRMKLLDARERRARQALLMGISTFLEVLNQPEEGEEEEQQG